MYIVLFLRVILGADVIHTAQQRPNGRRLEQDRNHSGHRLNRRDLLGQIMGVLEIEARIKFIEILYWRDVKRH